MQTNSLSHNAAIHNSGSHNASFSWGAVFAGAVACAAMTFILLILGFGLGLSVISPWADAGISAAAIGISTIIWLTLTQIISSGLGGYLAGRLRTKWVDVYHDEVFFRDSAHGLVTWAVATLIAVVLTTSAIGAVLTGGAKATATLAGGAAQSAVEAVGEMGAEHTDYFIDSLLRTDNEMTERADSDVRTELSTILFRGLMDRDLNADDTRYAARIVANYTGLNQRQAENRVNETVERARQAATEAQVAAKEAADTARKSAAYSALWLFIALLIGAFTAGLMAVVGGKQRDDRVLQNAPPTAHDTL